MDNTPAAERDTAVEERHAGRSPFRQEALDHYLRGRDDDGSLLKISPRWTRWAYPLLLFVLAGGLAFSLLGEVREYAAGPAVVRFEGHADVTATAAGVITAVEVDAGQRVEAGDVLVRLDGSRQAAELDRVEREFELALLQRLRDPADSTVERTLSQLLAQRQLARARLDERAVRAPRAGTVGDVRVRRSQHVTPGQTLLALAGDDAQLAIAALFPGHYRPLLEPGMALRFELNGYRYAYQRLIIERVDDEVIGPTEARRTLGGGAGEDLTLQGPLVLATARIPASSFESDGRRYTYHDGLQGTAEVRVRSERLLPALIPALKGFFNG